jgi:hypothetical protein
MLNLYRLCSQLLLLCCACDVGGAFESDGESDSQGGYSALIFSAANGHTDCVRLLIDAGADTEARNNVRRRSLPVLW